MIRPMIFTVWGFGSPMEVASFFTASDASDFAMHPERGFEQRNLYVSSGRYDERALDEQLTECRPDPFGKAMIAHDIGDAMDRLVNLSSRGAALPNKRAASNK